MEQLSTRNGAPPSLPPSSPPSPARDGDGDGGGARDDTRGGEHGGDGNAGSTSGAACAGSHGGTPQTETPSSSCLPTGGALIEHLAANLAKARGLSANPDSLGVIQGLEDAVTELAHLEGWGVPQRTLVHSISALPESAGSNAKKPAPSHMRTAAPELPPQPSSQGAVSKAMPGSDPSVERHRATSYLVSAGLTILVHGSLVAAILSLQRTSFVEFGSIPALNVCFCHIGLVSICLAVADPGPWSIKTRPSLLQIEGGWALTSKSFRVNNLTLSWWKLNDVAKGVIVAVHFFGLGVIFFMQTQQKACAACSTAGACTANATLPDGCIRDIAAGVVSVEVCRQRNPTDPARASDCGTHSCSTGPSSTRCTSASYSFRRSAMAPISSLILLHHASSASTSRWLGSSCSPSCRGLSLH